MFWTKRLSDAQYLDLNAPKYNTTGFILISVHVFSVNIIILPHLHANLRTGTSKMSRPWTFCSKTPQSLTGPLDPGTSDRSRTCTACSYVPERLTGISHPGTSERSRPWHTCSTVPKRLTTVQRRHSLLSGQRTVNSWVLSAIPGQLWTAVRGCMQGEYVIRYVILYQFTSFVHIVSIIAFLL